MPGDPDDVGDATVADSPKAKAGPDDAPTALDAAGRPDPRPTPGTAAIGTPVDVSTPRTPGALSLAGSSLSVTTAAAAMRDEEIERTRSFIAMGWAISVAAMGTAPFLDTPPVMDVVFLAAMALGIVVSFWFRRRFADPRKYTGGALAALSMFVVLNAHVAVLYYGAFTLAPLIVVLGIHFVARTEADRAVRWIYGAAAACHAAISLVIISGAAPDPGAFATDRPLDQVTLAAGAVFVQAVYFLAYYSARVLRKQSLSSIEGLQRATRLASQREALMQELRADLERALRVGGPGRHTDHTVGSFRLGVVLGRGAMGEVYDAVHTGTAEPAAVKLLRRELLADATHVARFLREAVAGGALASPHVVKVIETAADDAPMPYLAMERLKGQTLAEVLRRDGRLDPAAVVELAAQIGAGVDAAAAAGIVHRDLKPQNLFRCDGPAALWKILDFGVATLAEDSGTLTQGGVVGTPSYMAPEQAQGKRVDGRADVYAVAAVVYRCLTGRHPFTGSDTPALLYAVVHKMPVRPGALIDLHPDVDRWTAIALAKDPDQRFATGRELAAALAASIDGGLDGKLRKTADALLRKRPWDTGEAERPMPAQTTTLSTAADALHDEEVERTRVFLRLGWWVALGAAALTVIVPGDRRIAITLLAVLVAAVAVSMWIHQRLRDPSWYDPRKITPLAVAAVVCGQIGTAYVGLFSAAPLIVLLGLYFFCRTEHAAGALVVFVAAIAAQGVMAGLVISGTIEDPGFYPVGWRANWQAQIAGQLTALMAYGMAYWLARLTRKASLKSIEQLQGATRLAAQREAQVDELRQDLDRALKIGGPGRFTGHTVGAWQLGNVLGRGAMGEVYEATSEGGYDAAVKLLRRELLGDRKHVERFLREVRAASSLESPHVVKVVAASAPEDPLPFLAMERLRGATLGEQLRDGGALPRAKLVTLVEQIGAVLDRARAVGVVHRDLKPHNLFLTEDGVWKILDFGVALLGETSGTLTQGGVVGTPAYMAPEQAKGEPVDHRADLYALGALIYRCMTGRVPFVARDTPALLYAVVHQMPLRPSAIAPPGTASFDHDAFLAVALAKGKAARFQTGADLTAAFVATETGALADAIRRRARIVLRGMPWREIEPGTEQIGELPPW